MTRSRRRVARRNGGGGGGGGTNTEAEVRTEAAVRYLLPLLSRQPIATPTWLAQTRRSKLAAAIRLAFHAPLAPERAISFHCFNFTLKQLLGQLRAPILASC